jgi:hypothetical protein
VRLPELRGVVCSVAPFVGWLIDLTSLGGIDLLKAVGFLISPLWVASTCSRQSDFDLTSLGGIDLLKAVGY